MSELLFRAWDGEGTMYGPFEIGSIISERVGEFEVIEQYTGLKGYVGDIARGVIINGSYMDCEIVVWKGCFWFKQILGEQHMKPMYEVSENQYEIIGNIHQEKNS